MQGDVKDLFQGYAVNSEKAGIWTQDARFHNTCSEPKYDIASPLKLFITIPSPFVSQGGCEGTQDTAAKMHTWRKGIPLGTNNC